MAKEILKMKSDENLKRCKRKIAGLKRASRFVPFKESSGFARELETVLQEIKAGVDDPLTGVELIVAFFETDAGTFGRCDDSNGFIGDVYGIDAQKLFVEYASRLTDKEKIVDILFELNQKDDYGVRDVLIDCANQYLPVSNIRAMISMFQTCCNQANDVNNTRHWLRLIESLARQIKDAALFEKARLASWSELSTAACVDISQVYLESGDTQRALSWVEKVPENDTFLLRERNQLLIEIYRNLGDQDKLYTILHRNFRLYRSVDTLQELLDVIGKDKQYDVVEKEVNALMNQSKFNISDAEFLLSIGKIDEAETYILSHANQLNGDLYTGLIHLARGMEKENHALVASILYRALLTSILTRGYIKAYSYGIRYLMKLDRLSTKISDWKGFDDHEAFVVQIKQEHGRKRRFWESYNSK